MKAKDRRSNEDRRRRALKRVDLDRTGAEPEYESGRGVFIPQWRMRQIRWEDSLVNSQRRRLGLSKETGHDRMTCSCGSMECVGVPLG